MEKINYYSEKDFERTEINQIEVVSSFRALLRVFYYFIYQYIRQKGYKDGYHGFAICALDAFYALLNHLKAWEKKGQMKQLHDKIRDDFDEMLAKTLILRK